MQRGMKLWQVNDELERMREEALMAYFEVLTLTFAWRD
jgi:hypothetical protein